MAEVLTFTGVITALLSLSFVVAQLLRIGTAAALPVSVFLISILTLVLGLLNLLRFAPLASLLLIGILLLVSIRVRGVRSLTSSLREFASPALTLYVLFALITFVLTRGMLFNDWDEFSHWGTVVKALFLFDQLSPYNPADLMFRNYPPGAAVFEYFVSKFSPQWVEGNAIWAYHLAFASLFVSFGTELKWRRWLQTILVVIIFAATSIIFFDSFAGVLIEPLLAATFGFLLATVVVETRWGWGVSLKFAAGLSFLMLLKDSGVFLGIVAWLFFAAVGVTRQSSSGRWKRLLALALPLGIAIFFSRLWSLAVDLSGAEKQFANPIDPLRVIAAFAGEGPGYLQDVIRGFTSSLATRALHGADGEPWTWWFMLVLLTIFVFAAAWPYLTHRSVWSRSLTLSIPVLGALVYAAGLLVLYLTRFSPDEALALAAMRRYLATYLFGLLVFISLVVTHTIASAKPFKFRQLTLRNLTPEVVVVALYLGLLIVLAPFKSYANYLPGKSSETKEFRSTFGELTAQAVAQGVLPDDRVMVIAQHTSGFEYWILRYEFLPTAVVKPWSIGSPSGPGDLWTDQSIDAMNFQKLLANLDYVLIWTATESLREEFAEYFDQANLEPGDLFRVIPDENGYRLVPVG